MAAGVAYSLGSCEHARLGGSCGKPDSLAGAAVSQSQSGRGGGGDMPYVHVCDAEIFYRDEGSGPVVLLGHSSTGSSGQWRSLIARLSDRFRVIAPDHLGY